MRYMSSYTLLLLKRFIVTPNEVKMKLFWRILSRTIAFENVMKMPSECKQILRFIPKCPRKRTFENVMKMNSESLRLQEIGVDF